MTTTPEPTPTSDESPDAPDIDVPAGPQETTPDGESETDESLVPDDSVPAEADPDE